MPRQARVIIPQMAHHIVQRGNNRQWVLEEEEDFSNYCYWTNKYAGKYKVSILAYCLMNNHVHLIVVPEDEYGISRLFNTVHMRYAQYKNYKRRTSGHLWQGRFYSCVMDKEHLYRGIRYVEQNPVRAGMVKTPWEYEWSSVRWHLRKKVKKYIKVDETFAFETRRWKAYLMDEDKAMDDKLRKATHQGKAFAEEKFIQYWENRLKCSLRFLKPGPRPNTS